MPRRIFRGYEMQMRRRDGREPGDWIVQSPDSYALRQRLLVAVFPDGLDLDGAPFFDRVVGRHLEEGW